MGLRTLCVCGVAAADEDVAVGRADNGCVWVWDLAGALGWGDGSMPGAWEVMEEVRGLGVTSWCEVRGHDARWVGCV